MSTIRVNAIQHTSSNGSNMTLFANGSVAMTTANTTLTVGSTTISNSSISVGGLGISQYSGMMKNRIINGDFRIDQRFAGTANNNIAGSQYTVDRWVAYGSAAGKYRSQQNNTNGPGQAATQSATGLANYFGANTVSANTINAADLWVYYYAIEGLNVSDLAWGTANASPVTLSFWTYSSIPGTHTGVVQNSNQNRSYPFTYTINTANTWQQQTITIPGDTTGSWFSNNGIGMYLMYNLGIGSDNTTSTGNAWLAATKFGVTGSAQVINNANGSFYLAGVQLEKGSQATPFEFRHYGTELSLCQRYYWQIKQTGIGNEQEVGMFTAQSATSAYAIIQNPVYMRTVPTGIITGNLQWTQNGTQTTTTPSFVLTDVYNNMIAITVSGLTTGTTGRLSIAPGATGVVALSAELNTQN